MKRLLVLVLPFLLWGCFEAPSQDNPVLGAEGIVGGSVLKPNDPMSKYLAATMTLRENGTYTLCTATFISPRVLITAAHCLPNDKNPSNMTLYRSLDLNKAQQKDRFKVDAVVSHPEYVKNGAFADIALIRVKESPKDAKFAAVFSVRKSGPYSWSFMAYGYGQAIGLDKKLEEPEYQSGVLRGVEMWSGYYEKSLPYFTADLRSGKGICMGDSGGPAMYLHESGLRSVYGILSRVESLPGSDDYCSLSGIYVNVEYYHKWIAENLRHLEPTLILPNGL